MTRRLLAAALLACLAAGGCDGITDPGVEDWTPPARPAVEATPRPRADCADRDPLRRAYFGDLHVHTGFSMDARAWGLPLTPDDAYRYASGGGIALPRPDVPGALRRVRIDRPLDFAAVTDHAEWMAEVSLCTRPESAVYDTESCRIYRGEAEWWVARLLGMKGFVARVAGIAGLVRRNREVCGEDATRCREELGAVWQATQAAAERWYDRTSACRFTTFVGWEYSQTPSAAKVHRNVILRNEIAPELPLSWVDTPTPVDLWRRLREVCTESGSGCDAVSIPHNPNLSNGQLFAIWYRELPLEEQRREASGRAQLEPLVEMVQIKGESECRNGFAGVVGGPDELCDFEKMRDLPGAPLEDCGEGTGSGGRAGRGCTSRLDYARYALVEGLREEARIGVNPYRFGLIGSTDGHSATPGGVAETDPNVPFGSLRSGTTRDKLELAEEASFRAPVWRSAGGLVGLWAEENSRDALFDAMRRREAFATSGPRIRPRLYGGWGLPADLCERADFAAEGYRSGTPMGGVLPGRGTSSGAPRFAVSALADPGSASRPGGLLQRIQIVKGWVGEDGLSHQAVHEVAGDPGNGAGVDPESCAPHGPGAAQLCGVWEDPDFDPGRSAVYYARVVENPSCRWSTWQCLSLPPEERPAGCSDPRVPRTLQERAWTSPIWYTP